MRPHGAISSATIASRNLGKGCTGGVMPPVRMLMLQLICVIPLNRACPGFGVANKATPLAQALWAKQHSQLAPPAAARHRHGLPW